MLRPTRAPQWSLLFSRTITRRPRSSRSCQHVSGERIWGNRALAASCGSIQCTSVLVPVPPKSLNSRVPGQRHVCLPWGPNCTWPRGKSSASLLHYVPVVIFRTRIVPLTLDCALYQSMVIKGCREASDIAMGCYTSTCQERQEAITLPQSPRPRDARGSHNQVVKRPLDSQKNPPEWRHSKRHTLVEFPTPMPDRAPDLSLDQAPLLLRLARDEIKYRVEEPRFVCTLPECSPVSVRQPSIKSVCGLPQRPSPWASKTASVSGRLLLPQSRQLAAMPGLAKWAIPPLSCATFASSTSGIRSSMSTSSTPSTKCLLPVTSKSKLLLMRLSSKKTLLTPK